MGRHDPPPILAAVAFAMAGGLTANVDVADPRIRIIRLNGSP